MLFEEFLADLKTRLTQYDSSGLIDDMTVYQDVQRAIKKLGLLPLIPHKTMLEVKNGKAKLPDGFRKITYAVKCTPDEYEVEDDEDILQDSYMYKVKDIKRKEWDACDECDETYSEEIIMESLYFRNNKRGRIYYKKPIPLKLTNYVIKNYCDNGCKNIKVKECPYEIQIKNNILYANFKNGNIYLEYKGVEEDEDGMLIIPESDMGFVEEYITAFVKAELMLRIIENSDNTTNEYTLYTDYRQQVAILYMQAENELKFKGLKKSLDKYRKHIKREFSTYNF